MNLQDLSQKLEDHLTDQDIQDAQELLDDTYQEIVDMRGELVEAQAEIDALKAQNVELLAAQQWRDIESAPKDQTVLLAGEFAGDGDWRIKCGYFCSERNFWCIWGASWTPTRWQPLPPAPIAKARGDLT